jgi:hypothetical protein
MEISNNRKMQCVKSIKTEDHPEIRTILIGEPQKIILSPRVEFRRIIKQHVDHHEPDDNEPRVQIIAKPMPPHRPPPPTQAEISVSHQQHPSQQQQQLSPQLSHQHHHQQQQQQQQQQVRVIKDGRFYEECPQSRQQVLGPPQSQHQQQQEPRKFIVTRQINVVSPEECDNQVFRTPVVSSTSSSMRPPPPPPPPKVKQMPAEEPSSSIPDMGKANILHVFVVFEF